MAGHALFLSGIFGTFIGFVHGIDSGGHEILLQGALADQRRDYAYVRNHYCRKNQ
ncbi:MAG TPA: hypothetical protein PLV96_04050 [Methanoregulaceae archaeon]|nr:hypothetical protein [Methanoregulaceae archaeon]